MLDDVRDAGPQDVGGNRDVNYSWPSDAGWRTDACLTGTQPLYATQESVGQILIMLDRSQSMQESLGSKSRVSAAQDAIIESVNEYQSLVKFGFEQFPADPSDYSALKQCSHNSCCAGSVLVPPGQNNASEMVRNIDCGTQGSQCPTATDDSPSHLALEHVRDYFSINKSPSKGDQYAVLVTSSDPSCSSETGNVCDEALSAASDLGNNNPDVRVIVFSVGWQPDPGSCLVQISSTSSSSSKPPEGKTLYVASSPDQLKSMMKDFVSAVAKNGCTYDLWPNAPADTSQLVVSVSSGGPVSTPVAQATSTNPNGWTLESPANYRLIFSGTACDQIVKSQMTEVRVGYTCSTCGGPNACPYP